MQKEKNFFDVFCLFWVVKWLIMTDFNRLTALISEAAAGLSHLGGVVDVQVVAALFDGLLVARRLPSLWRSNQGGGLQEEGGGLRG